MVIAVVLSVVMRSMQKGTYGLMVENVVGMYTGHLQLQHPEFNDDKTIDNTFAADNEFVSRVAALAGVKQVLPRLESFALAAGSRQSRGVLVVGMDPEAEERFNQLSDKLVAGTYLDTGDHGALVAQELAKFLDCDVGDSLVLLGQGFHGASAAALLPVRGIIHFASPELDKRLVYVTCPHAQEIFSTGNRLTSLVVEPVSPRGSNRLAETLVAAVGTDTYAVRTWQELLPELVQQISGDNAGGLIMLGILYMVVAFGIFGTVLMMTSERMREFGVVNALGLPGGRLAMMAAVEILCIALMAGIAGTVISLPVVVWFHANPIELTGEAAKALVNYGMEPVMPFMLDWRIFASQALLVMLLSSVTALFPLFVLRKLNPVEAMRK